MKVSSLVGNRDYVSMLEQHRYSYFALLLTSHKAYFVISEKRDLPVMVTGISFINQFVNISVNRHREGI